MQNQTYKLYQDLPNPPKNDLYLQMEEDILSLFDKQVRKDQKTPMAFHSIRVGRSLILQKHDIITVFGGYYHDVVEDILPYKDQKPEQQKSFLYHRALRYMPKNMAKDASLLTFQCIYQDNEYQAQKEIGGDLGKKTRKLMALERWANSETRVKIIKKHDAFDNRSDLKGFNEKEKNDYLTWSQSLLEKI